MRSVEISLRQEIGELKSRCSALELEVVEYQQRELLAATEALQLREKAKEPDHRLSEYNLLVEQWNDLRDEVFRLHLANSSLSCQIERQEGKLAWLRSQRLNLLKLLHRANKTIRRLSILSSQGNFGLLPDRK
jgi:chromosome segregation ATPase